MSDMISAGKALYWGTSEWSADEIQAAWLIADRHHLHQPVMEQPQYLLFERRGVEREYARLYDDIGPGLTTWSPAGRRPAHRQVPRRCRHRHGARCRGYEWLRGGLTDARRNAQVRSLKEVGRPARLHAGPAGHRLVLANPGRIERHHRRQLRARAGRRQPRRRGRPRPAHPELTDIRFPRRPPGVDGPADLQSNP